MLRSRHLAIEALRPYVAVVLCLSMNQALMSAPPDSMDDEQYVAPVYSVAYEDSSDCEAIEQNTCSMDECDNCDCCSSYSGCCSPLLTIRAEAIIWDRVDGGAIPLVSSPVNVTTNDFNFDWRGGPRMTITAHNILQTVWDAEVTYFGIDGWQSQLDLPGINNFLTTPQINSGTIPGSIVYSSTLDSVEVNLRRQYNDWLAWMMGFRMIEVGEEQKIDLGAIADHTIDVNNHLYGGQFGLDTLLYDKGGPVYVDIISKVGIYSNNADSETLINGVGGALPRVFADGTSTPFVGELNFISGFRITDRLQMVGGYNLLWITDLALAPDQLAATNIVTGVATVDTTRAVFYHGASVGLQYSW